MGLIDFILNVAGVLLWFNWRSARLDPLTVATPATLAGTIRRTEPTRLKRWEFLIYVALLVFVRAFIYKAIGPAVDWTPKLNLGAIVIAFRSNLFTHQLLFSVLSLSRALLVFYFWLFVLAIINHRSNPDALQKLLLLQLGKTAQWPRWIQLAIPIVIAGLLWLAIYPLIAHWGLVNWAQSKGHLTGQCVVVGLGLFLSLKYLFPVFLLLYLISSYVYLGASPFWDFVATTSGNLLKPLNWIPLRFGKMDFAPIVGLTLLILLLFWPVPGELQDFLNKHQLTVWPS
jgi:uncharacterized protein YggT (Ycf19 family)